MNRPIPDPGSFRDPSGRIYHCDGKVYRTITRLAVDDFEFVRGTGLIERLVSDGRVIAGDLVSPDGFPNGIPGGLDEGTAHVVEHPRLAFISYPYEWPFPALKAAALLHLGIQIDALEAGVALSDASAYNIQFRGARPVFIDLLSFRRYQDGEMWTGHRQFCEQFLNPLLLRAKCGVAHNAWYRGTQEGITAGDLRRLLPWTSKLSRNILLHVVAQSAFQKAPMMPSTNGSALLKTGFPVASYRRMLVGLRGWIETLEPADTGKTVWQDYAKSHSYADDEIAAKQDYIADFARAVTPELIWDLGCNTGNFSAIALRNGAKCAIGFDMDQGALEQAFARAAAEDLPFTPLYLDGANPSPGQGWNECERQGFASRASADAVIALAFVHHLAIGRNIPLPDLADWLTRLAPHGVIEFVPKQDPMVQRLLALREDIFPDYTVEHFQQCLSQSAEIVEARTVTQSGRTLIHFRRPKKGR
ncbi:MAG: class I SAM-dependent methyltransferase [Alphaproteobacteria bacterium]